MTQQVLLLLDHGHPEAASYSIGQVFDYAAVVEQQSARLQAGNAILLQAALGTVPNMGVKPSTTRKAAAAFQKLIRSLTGGGDGEQ